MKTNIKRGPFQWCRDLRLRAHRSAHLTDGHGYLQRTFVVATPCPACGNRSLIGYYLANERGGHMHTRYVCTFWKANPPVLHAKSLTKPCGWTGWTVPDPYRQEQS